jgi:hypothetical protein
MTSKNIANATAARFRPNAKAEPSKELTSEKIAAHVEAFRASGGTIEVLGTTRVLTRLSEAAVPAKPG